MEGEAAGSLPEGTTLFDDQYPGIVNLKPDLSAAAREAATDAEGDGVQFHVTSGWRSQARQEQLFQEAVKTYGSEEEAARWVAPAHSSAHVTGEAIDIGPTAAMDWLAQHGARYGLCQIYANEPWHYELRPEAVAAGCPRMYHDATEDPRLG